MSNSSSRSRAGTIALTLFIVFASGFSCDPARSTSPAANVSAVPQKEDSEPSRIAAASAFTHIYKESSLADFNIRAHAAGGGCNVLLVEMPVIMEDSMIEAMHYGTGAYEVIDGGVQHFYRKHHFRGVIYRDGSEHIWPYGTVSEDEAKTLRACK